MLACRDLSVSVPGRTLVSALELSVAGGEFLAVLGPNGVGKSISMHTLAGLRRPLSGSIELNGVDIMALTRQQIASSLALLPQYTEDIFPTTVFDTVMIGRHPHIGRFKWESDLDREVARQSLALVDLAELVDRDVRTLSGGERRRLAVAQVVAQSPSIYLLDEPTNHLDPQHQLDVLRLFAQKTAAGDAVIASLHDVNLAARYADRCLLLYGDGRWEAGSTADVLTGDRLSALYGTPMESVPWRDTTLFVASG
jgi:iron complex transport system ATP-binding protein